jgi:hypothetical protein
MGPQKPRQVTVIATSRRACPELRDPGFLVNYMK